MYLSNSRYHSQNAEFEAAVVPAFLRSDDLTRLKRPEGLTRAYRKRQKIYDAGDAAAPIYEVVQGSLFIYTMVDDGRRQIVDLVYPGDFFGYAAGTVHLSGCETFEATNVLVFDRAKFLSSPEVQNRVIHQIGRRISTLHDHILWLGRKTAKERVASLLLDFASRESLSHCAPSNERSKEAAITIPMTRGEIADYLGLSLETVSRVLTALERRHLIEVGIGKGNILIKNVSRLRRIAKSEVRERV
jgi:CRP/FNR family nitrogen fixation transcriptional regulator